MKHVTGNHRVVAGGPDMIPAFGIDSILARDFFGMGMERPLSAAIDTLAAVNISRHLVEAMGSTIGFESKPDKETVFWFTCPLA